MKGKKSIWLLITILCYVAALGFYQKLQGTDNSMTLRLTGAFPNQWEGETLYEAESRQERPVDFTLWSSLGETTLENEELFRSSQAEQLLVCSRAELLFPDGGALGAEDQTGCLIDVATAKALFGSTGVIGREILAQGEVYRIRGVLQTKERVFVHQSRSEEETFSMVNLRKSSMQGSKDAAEAFLMRHHLQGEVVDASFLRALGKGGLLLLPMLLMLWFFQLVGRCYKESQGHWMEKAVLLVMSLCVCLAFVWMLSRFVTLSRDMIPTQWSDFGFWKEKWQEKTVALQSFLKHAKSPGQMELISLFARSMGCSLLSCMGYFGFRGKAS